MALPREFKKFIHSTRTSLDKARLTYHDAIALVIARMGNPQKGVTTSQVSEQVKTWTDMPHKTLVQYMSSAYCGSSESSTSKLKTARDPKSERVKTFWYKVAKGHYRLTKSGVARVASLQATAKSSKPMQLELGLTPPPVPKVPHVAPMTSDVPHIPKSVTRVISQSVIPTEQERNHTDIISTLKLLESVPDMTISRVVQVMTALKDVMGKHEISRADLIKVLCIPT